jgi:spore germination protein KC
MRKRVVSILLILPLIFVLTGCWDANEINELGFVLSVAVDKADDGYKVTAQIAKPDTYSKTPTGSSTQKEKPFWVVSSTGKTIFEAIRNMAAISPRRIFWAHIKVIIIGEELARSDITDLLDFFTRNPELRLRTLIAVTPGEAGKLLEIIPIMEKDLATYLEMIIENRNLTGKGYRIMLKNFLEKYLEPNGNPVASRIMLSKTIDNPVIELNGSAVFNKNKMVGWLDGTETRGLLWTEGKVRSTIMVINCPKDGKPVTIEVKHGKTSFKSSIENEVPYFKISVKASGNLVEQGCTTDFNDPPVLKELESVLESAIKDDIRSVLAATLKYKTDFIGLNDALHRQHKEDWQRLSKNWPEVLSKLKFSIDVKADIPSVSLMAKPLETAKNTASPK